MHTELHNHNWKNANVDVFWKDIAPKDHVLQVYESETVFLNALTGFVLGGFKTNETVVIIATKAHLEALNAKLRTYGTNIDRLVYEDLYIPLDADETLKEFMVDGHPDEHKFNRTISLLMARAHARKRSIRAFGEMVAILWAAGNHHATITLEHLWNRFCSHQSLCLFCAYPKAIFTGNESVMHVCNTHSKLINGSENHMTEVQYREIKA